MRVHPSLIKSGRSKWQYPAIFAFLLILLIVNLIGRPKQVIQNVRPMERMVKVLVTEKSIEAGQSLETAAIKSEDRPASLVPADAITSIEVLRNKVAAGPIPAGYPLARAFLADPMPILAVTEDQTKAAVQVDPVDTLLEEIRRDTVAVPVNFSTEAPKRGSRVAVAITGANGQTILLLDKAWISESSGSRATLRVEPTRALFIESARKLGNLSFIEIPVEGESPYSGNAVNDMESLEIALGLRNQINKAPVVAKKAEDKSELKGYAWVSGSKVRFGVGSDGSMHMVDSRGNKIDRKLPPGFVDENYDPAREEVP